MSAWVVLASPWLPGPLQRGQFLSHGLPRLRGQRRLDPNACSPSGQCLPAQRPEAPRRPAQPHRGGTERQAAQTSAGTKRHKAAMLELAWGGA